MSERFDNLDRLRTISCICIIATHIRANANFVLPSRIIESYPKLAK